MTRLFYGSLPIVLLAGLVVLLLVSGPLGIFTADLPPVQALVVERTVVRPDLFVLNVRNDGADSITIAQVMVNGAFWDFQVTPDAPISRLGTAVIRIPYPWVQADTEHITLISRDGLTFETSVEVATESPVPDARYIGTFALLGVYVGVVPVFLGLLWLPFLRRIGPIWFDFILAATLGLLAFLGIDALAEALDIAGSVAQTMNGLQILVIALAASILGLATVGRWSRGRAAAMKDAKREKVMLAVMVAFGIGIHNLGEGLAIGGAYAVGEAALGALLVIGFMIHNVTEGVAIIAPISSQSPRLRLLVGLGLLAGAPTILGAWIGGFAYSPLWALVFLAVGAGAIFQVLFDIARGMAKGSWGSLMTPSNAAGFLVGLVVMYATGLLVTA